MRDAIVSEAQGREEQHRRELVALKQQLADVQSRVAGVGEQSGELEQVRLEMSLEQRCASARRSRRERSHQDSKRAELATAIEKLHDVDAQLAAARGRQEEPAAMQAQLRASWQSLRPSASGWPNR